MNENVKITDHVWTILTTNLQKKKSVHEEPEPTKSPYMESVSLFEYAIVFFYNHRRQPSIKVKQNNLLGRGSYNEEPFNKEVMK